ncbi:hypothetical protein LCGC14_0428900 [marine sediment metagenome]|uniref:5-hmdU DNA kinase helical domain-containing protein n=1 Tax=marine sediment metagenome TaxID=412755 RepID=A0A0F9T6Q9_9ZZZZ
MKTWKVASLTPQARFLYWIKERHSIYLKRKAGKPKPWTDDEVLQSYFFTNPYREHDKTTVWFRENIRDPLRDHHTVLMATVIFRWFNRISTGQALVEHNLLKNWRKKFAIRMLRRLPPPVFTGAYMIKAGNGPKGCKIPNVCDAIDNLWNQRGRLVQVCLDDCRLKALWQELKQFSFLGGFMSYEIVCDLRYTYLLEDASDVNTWCNPGPGASRGLLRLQGETPGLNKKGRTTRVKVSSNYLEVMQDLLAVVQRFRFEGKGMPVFEMREVEHSLCEWDKYERALWQDSGRMKRKYPGSVEHD